MNISVRPINIESSTELTSYIKWGNDLEMYHLIVPMRTKEAKVEIETVESTLKYFEENPKRFNNTYIITDRSKLIGQISLQIDPVQLYKKEKGTAWFALAIGEKEYWGTGAALQAMQLFEDIVKSKGINRIELAVFEFNTRAQKFYKKLGYVEIGRNADFTYWNGRFWDDIRMEKYI